MRASASAEIAFTSIECAHARPLRSPLALRGMVVRRDVLDPAILNHARTCGARIEPLSARFDASTRTVRASDGSVWSAELVIGADGISSRVARDAGLARTGEQGRRFGIAFDFPLENPAVAQLVDAVEPRGEDFPGGHLVHWADFARDHSPKSHVVHDFDPATEYVPAGQVPQGAMPESENMPPGQTGMHADAPASDEKPTGHSKHVLELAFE